MKLDFKPITDQKLWDDFVCTFKEATMFDSWAWGEFEKADGKKYEFVGIYSDEKLVGILPVMGVRAIRGRYLHVRHAPLIDWKNEALVKATFEYLKKYARDRGYHFIRISPLIKDTPENIKMLRSYGVVKSPIPALDAVHTLKVDVTPSEDEILAQMRKNTRYSVRKAKKIGITVRRVTDFEKEFDIFWEIFQDGVARNKWVAFSKESVFRELMTFAKHKSVAMYISSYKGRDISAALFIFYNGRSYYHHSGSLTEFRNIPSTYLLIWEAFMDAKERGLKQVDLYGVSPEGDKKHPWYGLSLFKRGFGGKEYQMVESQDLIVHPFAHVTRLYEKLEGMSRGHF